MVERKDVEAALEARRELGREYEPEIVEAFLERIEQRLERQPGSAPARPAPRGSITPLALGSLGLGVGATAIAASHGAAWLAVVAWLAIAVVNIAWSRRV